MFVSGLRYKVRVPMMNMLCPYDVGVLARTSHKCVSFSAVENLNSHNSDPLNAIQAANIMESQNLFRCSVIRVEAHEAGFHLPQTGASADGSRRGTVLL